MSRGFCVCFDGVFVFVHVIVNWCLIFMLAMLVVYWCFSVLIHIPFACVCVCACARARVCVCTFGIS